MNLSSIFHFLRRGAILCLGLAALAGAEHAGAVTFKQQSLLSSGKWLKVNVSQSGIQQISHDQLREFGIDPERAVVYGSPAVEFLNNEFTDDMPDDLVPTYSENTADGKLLFYGEGPSRYDLSFTNNVYLFSRVISSYTNYSTYFITDCAEGLSPDVRPFIESPTIFSTHTAVTYDERELYNPRSVGAFLWDQPMQRSALSNEIKIKDYARAGAPVITSQGLKTHTASTLCQGFMATVNNLFSVRLTPPSGWSATNDVIDNQIMTFINRTVVNDGKYSASYTTSLSDATLADYTFSYKITPSPASSIQGTSATDYQAMIYPRHNYLPSSGQLVLHYLAGTCGDNVKVLRAGADTRVWNVTDTRNIYPYTVSAKDSDGSVQFSFDTDYKAGDPASKYIVFDASADLITPEIAGTVANQNLHAAIVPDFLIITTDAFLPLANELAGYHREYLGQDVAVFTQQQIFNEFSSGAPAAMAYRRFAKMLYDRNPSKFRNLLLYGAGQWDNRKLVSPLNFEALLTYQTESTYDLAYATAYVADTYFGMLSDNYSQQNIAFEPLQIGVGRIPASVHTDAQKVNNKIRKFLQNPLPVSVATRALMVSDAGDECEHFKQSEQACSLLVANRPALTVIKGHRAAYTNEDFSDRVNEVIKQSLTSGVSLFGYSGHGSQNGFCWSKTQATATSYEHPPFVMLSTCDPYCFHLLANSLAESMLYKEDGGAIGVVGAMCSVYLPYNQYYNLSVLDAWSKAKAEDTFGDVMIQAKNSMLKNYRNISSNSQIFTNALCYNYCGDPALPVPSTDFGIKVEKVNGSNAASNKVYPRVPVVIEGAVTNARGSVNTAFNGNATFYLFEAPYHGSTRVGDGQKEIQEFYDDSSLLAQVGARVENGRFKATIISPQPQITDLNSRLLIVAEGDDATTASGSYNGLILGLTSESTPGQVSLPGPAITDISFDDPGYAASSVVAPSCKMTVSIDAPAGLNSATSNIGYGIKVMYDGSSSIDPSLISIIPTAENTYTAVVDLRDMTYGRHDISVSVADNALKRADAAVSFTVGNSGVATLKVDQEALPARESLTFDLEADNLTASTHKLVIRNTARETVFTADVTFPYEWNLTATDGTPLAEGFYTAGVICSGTKAIATQEIPVTIIR